LRRSLSRRITATDRKVLVVQRVSEPTLIKLLEVTLAFFFEEKLGNNVSDKLGSAAVKSNCYRFVELLPYSNGLVV
jgi:hypothetical protein